MLVNGFWTSSILNSLTNVTCELKIVASTVFPTSQYPDIVHVVTLTTFSAGAMAQMTAALFVLCALLTLFF